MTYTNYLPLPSAIPHFPLLVLMRLHPLTRRQRYNEYVLCAKKNHGDESTCQQAKQHARSICPDEWVSLLHCVLINVAQRSCVSVEADAL